MDLVIKNGKIVSPTGIISAAIGVDKGKIVDIATEASLPGAERTIDAAGKYILPGVCDMHCHEDFPGKEEDGFYPWTKISKTEPMTAALGGVTTMGFYMMPPGDKSVAEVFESYRQPWESNSITDGIFHIMAVNELRLDEMESDCSEYGITDFKFLLGYKGAQAAAQGHAGIDDGFIVDGFYRIARMREKGWPVMTILRGEVIAEDLKVVAEPGYGKYIPRKKM